MNEYHPYHPTGCNCGIFCRSPEPDVIDPNWPDCPPYAKEPPPVLGPPIVCDICGSSACMNDAACRPAAETPEDAINPAYYVGRGGMQPNHVVDAFGLDYNAGTALVYLIRAGRKGDRLTDLRKCRHYIDRCIAAEEAAR